ncbi:MAG: protein kinase [Planctomycetes bacterium]|nr:protein kinase [Planctomycetota bacterium]
MRQSQQTDRQPASTQALQATIPPSAAAEIARETIRPGEAASVPEIAASAPGVGRSFGRYEILEALGQGAMGAVYKARDSQLDRIVALKVPKFAGDGDGLLERFYREARAAAALRHPGICPVHDVGAIDGTHYISMGYIDGRRLSEFIQPQRPLPERQAAAVVRKIALALDEAHRHGVIHRDLKPDNIMLDGRGQPVVMDFGLARRSTGSDVRATQTGQMLGTPAYMSREQVDGDVDRVGPSSDMYSLGVILYELTTGRLPFEGSIASVLAQIVMGQPQSPSAHRPELDRRLESICLKMMARDAAARYGSMTAVAEALTAYLKSTSADVAQELSRDLKAYGRGGRIRRRSAAGAIDVAGRILHPKGLAIAAAGLIVLFGLVWGVTTIYVRSETETIRIEIDDPSARVFVDNDEARIEGVGDTVRLTRGVHKLAVKRGDVVVKTDEFTVVKGENPVLRIALLESANSTTGTGRDDAKPVLPESIPAATTQQEPTQERSTSATTARARPIPPVSSPPPVLARPGAAQRPFAAATPERRATLEWLIKKKGSGQDEITLRVHAANAAGRQPRFLRTKEDIPTGDFDLTTLGAHYMRFTDKEVARLLAFPELESLGIVGDDLTDAAAEALVRLKNLKQLYVLAPRFTDAGVTTVTALEGLESLTIGRASISDAAAAAVVEMRSLKKVGFPMTPVTDEALRHLATLPELESVNLNGTSVNGTGFTAFADHPGLKDLSLGDARITDAGLESIGRIRGLRYLYLWGNAVTDDGVRHLTGLKELQHLVLGKTAITDRAADDLRALTSLRMLALTETAVSDAVASQLKEALPECSIQHAATLRRQ